MISGIFYSIWRYCGREGRNELCLDREQWAIELSCGRMICNINFYIHQIEHASVKIISTLLFDLPL